MLKVESLKVEEEVKEREGRERRVER